MAEWLKAAVLKTADLYGSGSSNLSPSARENCGFQFSVFSFLRNQRKNLKIKCSNQLPARIRRWGGDLISLFALLRIANNKSLSYVILTWVSKI